MFLPVSGRTATIPADGLGFGGLDNLENFYFVSDKTL